MRKVKIYGAGSIGNHLAYACRQKGWDVLICDLDEEALTRTREDIYPSRYGCWDEGITLTLVDQCPSGENYDLIIIGTPPDSHMKLALKITREESPSVLLIEKPLATPDLKDCEELYRLAKERNVQVLVGYNHTTTPNTAVADKIMDEGSIGKPLSISVRWLEYWGGIFNAHPWLAGPHDSYLGFWERGGGACGEHSHCINLFQHFALKLGAGRITSVFAMMDFVEDGSVSYDRVTQLNVKTEKGLIGSIITDVITEPPVKTLRVQGEKGFIEWYANHSSGFDALITNEKEVMIPKSRPDDFQNEIETVASFLEGTINDCPISLERGLDTMLVIAAAYKSATQNKPVSIDYARGYSLDAIIG